VCTAFSADGILFVLRACRAEQLIFRKPICTQSLRSLMPPELAEDIDSPTFQELPEDYGQSAYVQKE
jgi:hypothetical protein